MRIVAPVYRGYEGHCTGASRLIWVENGVNRLYPTGTGATGAIGEK
jgi:hypothetical protein